MSYAAAAEELHVTPAAVGQLIRGLESNLGVELFHRSTSGATRLSLTDAARSALPDMQMCFDLLSTGLELIRSYNKRIIFNITTPSAFADKWLLPRIEIFQQKYPYYELRIDTSNQLTDFNSARVDIGIRYGAGNWRDLASTLLMRDDFFPVCSPSLLEKVPPLQTPADLAHCQLIHDLSMGGFASFPTWRSWLYKTGYAHAVDSDRGLRLNDSAAAIQTAIAGNGVALVRTTLVQRDIDEGRLIRLFDASQSCELAYYVVHKPDHHALPRVAAFKEWLIAQACAAGHASARHAN